MDLFRLALGANGMNVERRTIVLSERGSAEKRRLGKMSSPIGRRWLRCGQPEKYLRPRPPEILILLWNLSPSFASTLLLVNTIRLPLVQLLGH